VTETAEYRLPRDARPRRYELELTPDLASFSFDGVEVVGLDVVRPVQELVCNAVELDIFEARLETPAGTELTGRVALDEEAQRATIAFDEQLQPGSGYRLHLRFTGLLNDQLHGFYRSTLVADDGSDQVIAVTQFESTDARRAFPCWDEPEFKASFAVSLVVDDQLTALSNGAILSEEPVEGGRRRVRFRETMIMSTYLVAFVVGSFEATRPDDVDGVPLRVVAVPGKQHLTGFAREAGSHALRFFSQYFELPYPADKIDHVAIPDFAFGAMENLGCVTYRENALLVNPAEASQLELQRVATVVAHETAHMWFGDLVTMRWWNGIWLNEAFATFMELAANDDFRPEWQVWTVFGSGKAAALATDGLRNTRPVEFPVGQPEEAEAMFDVLTYQKGAAVLRMLEQHLGPETFRKGISHYLTVHAHANTETGDLWDALEAVSGEPVRAIMDTWILQGGYPLISVEPGEDPASIRLTQERFLYDAAGAGRQDGGERWAVPITLRASVGGKVQRQRLLVDGASATVNFDGPVDWIVVNDGGWGFYRVRYAPALLGRLTAAGLPAVCDPLERMGLVVDSWAGVVGARTTLEDWVGVVESLGEEDDPDVWAAVNGAVGLLDLIATDTSDRSALRAFIRRVASRAWARLGWDPAPSETERLGVTRGRLVAVLGMPGQDPEVRREARARFDRFRTERAGLAPDLLTPVANVVAASGGEEGWAAILDQYRSATTPQDKVRYLQALASTPDPSLLARTLDLAISDEVRTQDAPFLVAGVMSNQAGASLAWAWVERHWNDLQERMPSSLVARIFEGVTSIVDRNVAAAIHAFAAGHDLPLAGPRLDQLLERMDINVALAGRLAGGIAGALGRWGSGGSGGEGP
jgi:puromycin-sensitive aminopeptidase